jgi:DNA-binding HxlR family transcriptional regulator
VHSINPPHVVYTLAPEGSQVLPILTTLAEWQNERVAQYEASLAPAERSDIAEIAAS